MFRLPWVSRHDHDAVVAAKDELIAYQRQLISDLREMLARPVAVTVTLPEDFAVIQPAIVRTPRKREVDQRTAAFQKIDWAEIDEKNPDQLRTAVDFILGPRAKGANRYERRHALNSVLANIQAAREKKLRDRSMALQEPQDSEPDAANVPLHIKQMIENAEKGA